LVELDIYCTLSSDDSPSEDLEYGCGSDKGLEGYVFLSNCALTEKEEWIIIILF
jgi:hypothetical protein